jgi:hypothetical protein
VTVATARTSSQLGVALVLTLIWGSPATAQQPVASLEGEAPYVTRVSLEDRSAATTLVKEGNEALHDKTFLRAEKKFRDALARWEHPAIHYNLALALSPTLRPTEVHEHMLAAMQHGPLPLGTKRYNHARTLTERMRNEYARVSVSCDCEATAKLSSGDWLVRKKPGRFQGLVPPGTHTLVATVENHPPTELTLSDLKAGQEVHLRLDESRPYSTWKIVAAMGAGAAVAAGGGFLHVQAGKDFRAFDDGINRCGGCTPVPDVARHRKRALTLQKIAVGSYALGGTAILMSLFFLYNNQLQSQFLPSEADEARFVIAPMLGRQEQGLWATFRF